MKKSFCCMVVVLAGLLQACSLTYPIQVKQEGHATYEPVGGKRYAALGVYLDDGTKNYVIDSYRNGGHMIFHVGEALTYEAPVALQSVADEVVLVEKTANASPVDQILSLKFGPATEFVVGRSVVSDQKVTIELEYQLADSRGNILQEGTTQAIVERSIGGKGVASGLLGGLIGSGMWEAGIGEVANDGVVAALQNLNRDLSTPGSN